MTTRCDTQRADSHFSIPAHNRPSRNGLDVNTFGAGSSSLPASDYSSRLTPTGLIHLDKYRAGSPSIAAVGGAVGLIWACMLVASGLVFNYGAAAVVDLYEKSPAQAVSAWQAIEPVAQGLGSAQGELLGGLWVLLVSVAALRTAALPKALNWLGILTGTAGIASVIPVLLNARLVFGMLQIVWFIWVGIAMFRTRASEESQRQSVSTP